MWLPEAHALGRTSHSSPGRSRFRISANSRVYRRLSCHRPARASAFSRLASSGWSVGSHDCQSPRPRILAAIHPWRHGPSGAAIMAPSLGATDTSRQEFRGRRLVVGRTFFFGPKISLKPTGFDIAIQGWKMPASLRMMPPNSSRLAFLLNRWTRH